MSDERTLAIIDGAVWPPLQSVIELGDPNRDAVVTKVRMRLQPSHALILVDVVDLVDEFVPRDRLCSETSS